MSNRLMDVVWPALAGPLVKPRKLGNRVPKGDGAAAPDTTPLWYCRLGWSAAPAAVVLAAACAAVIKKLARDRLPPGLTCKRRHTPQAGRAGLPCAARSSPASSRAALWLPSSWQGALSAQPAAPRSCMQGTPMGAACKRDARASRLAAYRWAGTCSSQDWPGLKPCMLGTAYDPCRTAIHIIGGSSQAPPIATQHTAGQALAGLDQPAGGAPWGLSAHHTSCRPAQHY